MEPLPGSVPKIASLRSGTQGDKKASYKAEPTGKVDSLDRQELFDCYKRNIAAFELLRAAANAIRETAWFQ